MQTPTATIGALLGRALLGVLDGPSRGPGRQIDPRRTFDADARRAVMVRADGRCEAPSVFASGRCGHDAVAVDHIFPWRKGGATVVSNAQALCQHHHDRMADRSPSLAYVLRLESRREKYFPEFVDVRVRASLNAVDLAARGMATTSPRSRLSLLSLFVAKTHDSVSIPLHR